MSEEVKSKSKLKREAREAAAKAHKRKNKVGNIVETIIGLIIAGVFVTAIVLGILQNVGKVKPGSDYSAFLTEEGFIDGADMSAVKDLGLDTMTVPMADVEYTEDDLKLAINSLLSQHMSINNDETLTVADGDKVNIDYVGSVDGVEFEGGNSGGEGYDLVIGSGSFIDDFEQQLIGTHPGDNVTVDVTFPDEYSNNPDLAGKDAVFEVTVNGINTMPEFDDNFVKVYVGTSDSVEEYKEKTMKEGYESNLKQYISNYISENAEVSKYPKDYVKNVKSLLYFVDEQNYQYLNQYYGGSVGEFSDYTGMSDVDYQKNLKERAEKQTAQIMTFESIFKKAGLTVTDEMYEESLASLGDEETYGKPYVMQNAITTAVMDYLLETVNVQ